MEKVEKPVKIINRHTGGGGAVYGLGLIGAIVYFIQHATSFSDGVWGVLQAIVWPAIFVYKLLEMWKM